MSRFSWRRQYPFVIVIDRGINFSFGGPFRPKALTTGDWTLASLKELEKIRQEAAEKLAAAHEHGGRLDEADIEEDDDDDFDDSFSDVSSLGDTFSSKWCYFVLLCAFLNNAIIFGVAQSLSTFFAEWQEDFQVRLQQQKQQQQQQ